MSNVLLALWIALIGADRIDLAGGNGPFILTPFLALTPLVLVAEFGRRLSQGTRVTVSRTGVLYMLLAGALLTISMASVFVAQEIPVGAARAMLLGGDLVGTLLVALLVADRDNLPRIMASGAIAGLGLYLLFDPAEALWWIAKMPQTMRFGPVLVKFGDLQNLGPLPRLAGPVADGNRAGYVLLCYIMLIARGEPRAWLRRTGLFIAAFLMMFTFSRSAMLGVIAASIVTVIERRRISPRVLIGGPLLAAAAAIVLMAAPTVLDRASRLIDPAVFERFSTVEGSGRDHLDLVERGIGEATQSIPRALIGLGYGNSYLVLQDVFPGNRYGSFHSLFVASFAESGVFALLLVLILLFVPAVRGGPWRTVIAGSIAFNLFYSTVTEPIFWFLLALAWLTLGRRRPFVPAESAKAHPQFRLNWRRETNVA